MLKKFRSQTFSSIESLCFQTALYWAEKAVTASAGLVEDIYMLGKCMYFCKQYHRAAQLITKKKLDEKYLLCKHLAAQCFYEAQMYSDALHLLKNDHLWNGGGPIQVSLKSEEPLSTSQQQSIYSSMYLLRGKVHEAMDNRIPAIEDYKNALKYNVYCNEAFDLLIRHEMLSPSEENDLLDNLPFDEQSNEFEGETSLLRALYTDQIRKYCKMEDRAPSNELSCLKDNLSIRVNYAQRMLNGCDFRGCLKELQQIMKEDPNHQAFLPVYITCLVSLKKPQLLFTLAHRLVDSDPDSSTSWYAVGCYYYVIGRFEESRKYLHKTTTLDRNHGAAWMVRGHAFASENEHDQAMAAYFKASQLMRGSHLPMLYVGLEHGLMSNVHLANSFFHQAHTIAPDDPFVLHELGSVAFQNRDYQLAEKCYLQAVDMVGRLHQANCSNNDDSSTLSSSSYSRSVGLPVDDTWEPLLNNLGHVSRKLKKYELAIEYHQKALLVCPMKASTFAALGYVYALMNDAGQAVEYFQKALALKRDDTFSTTMLNSVLETYLNEALPFSGAPSEVPPPVKIVPDAPTSSSSFTGLMQTPVQSERLQIHSTMASTSNMEMSVSNMSMPDISEEDALQMDSPGFYLDSRPANDSVMSGVGPLHTPACETTPVTTVQPSAGGFRPGELGMRVGRPTWINQETEIIIDDQVTDEDSPIQRR